MLRTEPPAMVRPALFAPAWSMERATVFTQEANARLYASSLPSIQAECDEDEAGDEYEFEAIPLVAVQTVRVRFRDIGQLPPPSYFKDEPVLDE